MARSSDENQRSGLFARPPFDARELLGIGLLGILMIQMLSMSWARWLDPLIDAGRDLYVSSRIALGGVELYRDIGYIYPPLTPYLLAGVVRLLGSSLLTYTIIGIAVSLVTVTALYIAARLVAGSRLAAFLAAALFLSLNFTGATTEGMNFIFPYAAAATVGMALVLLFMVAMLAYLFMGRSHIYLLMAFAFGLLAAWTKLEYTVFFLVSIAVCAILHEIRPRDLAALATVAAALFAGVWYLFSDAPPSRHWLFVNVLPGPLLRGSGSHYFYSQVLGTIDIGHNLEMILLGAALTAVVALAIIGCERVQRLERRAARLALSGILIAIVIGVSFALSRSYLFFQGWSLIQVALIPWALWKERKRPLAILLVFSLLATSRVFFRLIPAWYGFVFTIPLYLLIVYVLFEWLPETGAYSRRWSLLWVPLFVVIAWQGIAFQKTVYSRFQSPVVTPKGTFMLSSPGRANAFNHLLATLSATSPRSLVVFPEGVTLNYFTGIPNPMPYYAFIPIEIATPINEKRITDSLRETKPDAIVMVSRDMSEYGYKGFGIDYAKGIWSYLTRDYEPVETWKSDSFTMTLATRADLRRTPGPESSHPNR